MPTAMPNTTATRLAIDSLLVSNTSSASTIVNITRPPMMPQNGSSRWIRRDACHPAPAHTSMKNARRDQRAMPYLPATSSIFSTSTYGTSTTPAAALTDTRPPAPPIVRSRPVIGSWWREWTT